MSTRPKTPIATPNAHWSATAAGAYILQWERAQYDAAVAEIFGYYAMQIGGMGLQTLAESRIQQRWLGLADEAANANAQPQLRVDYEQLPLAENSMDLLTLPHTLELSKNPHATLRDAARALLPSGTLLISGFHTPSLWFSPLAGKRAARSQLPTSAQLIAHQRLLDWLGLVGLTVEAIHYGAYRPLGCAGGDYSRWAFMERLGNAFWPYFGAAYFLRARKQVLGATYLQPQWHSAQLSANTVPAALNQPVQNTNPNTPARNHV